VVVGGREISVLTAANGIVKLKKYLTGPLKKYVRLQWPETRL
jgi:hypothetical protein